MRKNKVFIISPTESVLTQRGKRHPNLARYLMDRNIDIHYITSTINHASKEVFTPQEIECTKESLDYSIDFIDVGLYKNNISVKRFIWNIHFAKKVHKTLKHLISEGDILIFPSRPPELPFIGSLLKKKYKVKLILDIEDIWPDAFLINNRLVKSCFYGYCNFLNKRSIPRFDSSFHVSPSFLNWFYRYTSNENSLFSSLGITEEEDNLGGKIVYSSEPVQYKFFYGGTLSLQFDILPLLKALNKSNLNFHISLAGDNGSGQRSKEVLDYLIQNNISFKNYGLLEKQKFIAVLGESDIAILPMISGGLPKKFFDALGGYKPIFCIGQGGAYDEIKKFGLGWATSFDVAEILGTIQDINMEELNKIIENITKHRERYLEEYSLDIIYKEILKLTQCNN